MLERLVSFLPYLCFGLFMNIYVNILNIVLGGGGGGGRRRRKRIVILKQVWHTYLIINLSSKRILIGNLKELDENHFNGGIQLFNTNLEKIHL